MIFTLLINSYDDYLEFKVEHSNITYTDGVYHMKGSLYGTTHSAVGIIYSELELKEDGVSMEVDLVRDTDGRSTKVNFDIMNPSIRILNYNKINVTLQESAPVIDLWFCNNFEDLVHVGLLETIKDTSSEVYFESNSEAKHLLDVFEGLGKFEEYQTKIY